MAQYAVGNGGRVAAVHLDAGEDLLSSLASAVRDHGIGAGYIPSITGAVERARLQRFAVAENSQEPIEVFNVEGPMECSGTGIVGTVHAPDLGSDAFGIGRYVHGDPYIHVHMTVSSSDETVCGHLMQGTTVHSFHPVSHFTVFIVEVTGLALELRADRDIGAIGGFPGVLHRVTEMALPTDHSQADGA